MFSFKYIVLIFYAAFILITPPPSFTIYSGVVNWTGFLLSNIPVVFSTLYNLNLPKVKLSILRWLLTMLMLQLHTIGRDGDRFFQPTKYFKKNEVKNWSFKKRVFNKLLNKSYFYWTNNFFERIFAKNNSFLLNKRFY